MKETENPLDLISSCDDNHQTRSSGGRVLTIAIVLILLVLIIVGVIITIMVTNKVKKTADSISEVKETVIEEFGEESTSEDIRHDLDTAMDTTDTNINSDLEQEFGEESTSENFEQDLNRAMDTIDASTSAVFAQQFATYDYTRVSGDGVINAIKLFEGSPVAIIVQTEKSCGPEFAFNYGALVTSDCKESDGSNNSPLFDVSNQCYIVFIALANPDKLGIQKNNNGRDYLASLHCTGDSMSYYYPDYERLNDEDDIQYIDSTSSFKSNLIRDDSGSIIGIYFKEPAESEEKLDSAIFISDRKEYKSDLTEDELSKYDDKDITAQDVLDLASIAADKNTAILIQTTALKHMAFYGGNTGNAAVNYGLLLPSIGVWYSVPHVMTEHPELCDVYNGDKLEYTLDLDSYVDYNLINNTTKFVVMTIVAEEADPETEIPIYRYDNFYISDLANRTLSDVIYYTHDTTALTDEYNAAYIIPSHKYHANLIEDYKGIVIGVYIKEK